jgi:hypothetical protein
MRTDVLWGERERAAPAADANYELAADVLSAGMNRWLIGDELMMMA